MQTFVIAAIVLIVVILIWYFRSPDSIPSPEYIGTYLDGGGHRNLPRAIPILLGDTLANRVHTFEGAVAAARATGKKYMGLQDWHSDLGGQVLVADEGYDKYGLGGATVMDDEGHKWGGGWANAMYKLE